MVPFKNRLYTTPAGSRGGNTNISGHSVVYESSDPARGGWRPVSDFGFGDVGNKSLHEVCAWATTSTSARSTTAASSCGAAPARARRRTSGNACWNGARGAAKLNQGVLSLYPVQGLPVRIGTGIQGGGIDRQNDIGPGASEADPPAPGHDAGT